jgi:O-antigen/teichoic acid export membrane protein
MSNNDSLQQIAKGAGLLFVGTAVIYLIRFIYRLIVSRYLGPADYGLLSLAEGVLNIAFLIAVLGLPSGIIKFVSHYFGTNRQENIKGTILSVFKIIIPFSLLISILIIVFSQYISIGLFNKKELVPILVIFALAVPFYALTNVLSGIFVAFKKIQYRNYLTAFTRPISSLALVIIFVLLGKGVYFIALAILVSHILPVLLGSYLLEFRTFPLVRSKIKAVYKYKGLLKFSLPLLFSDIFIVVMGWIDTFFLGALKTATEVGVYNAVLPLVSTLTIFLSAFGNMFFPVSSELYAKNKFAEISATYSSVSRWMFLLSFPILLVVLIFPRDILRILFGSPYASGALALQILVVAYFIKVVAGPAPQTLMAFNKTKPLFYVNSLAAVINLFLNYFFIIKYGIVGAAMATAISLLARDGVIFLIARKKLRLVYALGIYLKYIISALLPLLFILLAAKKYIGINLLTLSLTIITYCGFYLFFLIIFKAFTQEDFAFVEIVEKKVGISLKIIKKLIR